MCGSAARSEFALWQQVDPKPSTTSTAPLTRAGPLAALALAMPAPWPGAVRSSLAATPTAVPPGPGANRTVPVKASRAIPTTRASTITAASGAMGTHVVRCRSASPGGRNPDPPGTPRSRGGCPPPRTPLAAAVVSPYQARASTIPASPATATTPGVSRRAIRAEDSDSTPKLATTHAAVPAGGSRRHQAWPTPPWLSATAVPSRMGTAARKGQENGSSATPNISVTTGDITSPTSTVSTAQDTSETMNRGRGRPCSPPAPPFGQASMTSTASTAERTTTRSRSTPVKPSHGWLNANSQRRSW